MHVVAFNGSPRAGGNTERLIKAVFEPLEEAGITTEIVKIGGHALRGCVACGQCRERKNNRCVIESDMINDCIAKMNAADAIILGSPTYFADVSTEMKALIDRAGYVTLGNGRTLSRKIGAAVMAVRRGGAIHAFDTMNHFFMISRMIVPGSTYWNFGIGRNPGEVENDAEGLANMRDLGETIAWLLRKTAGASA